MREVVGPGCPVMSGHDSHCNMGPQLAGNATAMIIRDTYPHIDMAARALEAVRARRTRLAAAAVASDLSVSEAGHLLGFGDATHEPTTLQQIMARCIATAEALPATAIADLKEKAAAARRTGATRIATEKYPGTGHKKPTRPVDKNAGNNASVSTDSDSEDDDGLVMDWRAKKT